MDKDYREDEGFIRYQNNLDERSRRNMRRFASFMAKMIDLTEKLGLDEKPTIKIGAINNVIF